MKVTRQFAIGTAVLASVLAAYIGAYWFVHKSQAGSEFFESDTSSFQNWPAWTHHAKTRIFRPATKAEQYLTERRERSRYIGGWAAESGSTRIEIDSRLAATVHGFSSFGFADGSVHPCRWMHLPGGEACLIVKEPNTAGHLQISISPKDDVALAISMAGAHRAGAISLWRERPSEN